MITDVRWTGLSVSEAVDILGFSCITIFRVYKEKSKKEKKNALLVSKVKGVWSDCLKPLITTKKNISECIFKIHSNRRPHQMPLVSAKNRKQAPIYAGSHGEKTGKK